MVDDWTLYRFVEPAFVFVLAIVLGFLSGIVGIWLFVAAVTLFIKNNHLYSQAQGQMQLCCYGAEYAMRGIGNIDSKGGKRDGVIFSFWCKVGFLNVVVTTRTSVYLVCCYLD